MTRRHLISKGLHYLAVECPQVTLLFGQSQTKRSFLAFFDASPYALEKSLFISTHVKFTPLCLVLYGQFRNFLKLI